MIEDTFIENHVKRDNGISAVLFVDFSSLTLLGIIVAINVIPMIYGLNIIFVTGMISAGLVWGLVVIIQRQYVEYEIEISNDSVSIAKIIAKKKREELADFTVKECEYIGPVTSDRFSSDSNHSEFKLNITAYRKYAVNDDNWYALVSQNGVRYIVIFGFKPEMYKVFRRYNPRNVAPYIYRETVAEANSN